MNLAQLCQSDPELGKKAVRFMIATQQIKGRNRQVTVRENASSDHNTSALTDRAKNDLMNYKRAYNDLADAIKKEHKRNQFNCVICHPEMRSFMENVIADIRYDKPYDFDLITLDTDMLRYNVVTLKDTSVNTTTMVKAPCLMATRPDEHGDYFFDKKLLDEFCSTKAEEKPKETLLPKDTRIREINKSDGTREFLVEKYVICKDGSSITKFGDGLVGTEKWHTASSHQTLPEAKEALKKLREGAPSIVKEVIHED